MGKRAAELLAQPNIYSSGCFWEEQPTPSLQEGLQCRTAIPQVHPQGPSLATASPQSMALLPQQDGPLLVGPSDCLWHCCLSPPASPIPAFICSGRNRAAVVLVS